MALSHRARAARSVTLRGVLLPASAGIPRTAPTVSPDASASNAPLPTPCGRHARQTVLDTSVRATLGGAPPLPAAAALAPPFIASPASASDCPRLTLACGQPLRACPRPREPLPEAELVPASVLLPFAAEACPGAPLHAGPRTPLRAVPLFRALAREFRAKRSGARPLGPSPGLCFGHAGASLQCLRAVLVAGRGPTASADGADCVLPSQCGAPRVARPLALPLSPATPAARPRCAPPNLPCACASASRWRRLERRACPALPA